MIQKRTVVTANKSLLKPLLLIFLCFVLHPKAHSEETHLLFPDVLMQGISYDIGIHLPPELVNPQDSLQISVNSIPVTAFRDGDNYYFEHTFRQNGVLMVNGPGFSVSREVQPVPLWLSVFPPLIAIIFALLLKEVFSALFIGLLFGTALIAWYGGSHMLVAVFEGMFRIVDTYIAQSLVDEGHISIIVFSMLIGGMVHIITRNGGMNGVVDKLSRYARSPRSGQLVTWFLGVAIFFDDYANTLVVGNTMRPVADRLKISREKLAYVVDSTAAPIAAIAFVTTWIGAELSYIQSGTEAIGIEENAYSVFFHSLAYSFYPIFTLGFMLILILRKRDFGPMRKAEQKARAGEAPNSTDDQSKIAAESDFKVEAGIKARWYNALIPVLVIIFGTLAGLLYTGWDSAVWNDETLSFFRKISIIIGGADSYKALLWSSLSGVLVAVTLSIAQRLLNLQECMGSLIEGFKTMLTAIVILVLAWSIALLTEHMHTATYISNLMVEIAVSPFLIPFITFILAALVAFSTGSSWGTMAILYPLILPAGWLISQNAGLDHETSMALFYNVVSTVLAGSVLGDHCSPISDTTILSSLASGCNHLAHVRTQIPYAISVGVVSLAFGTLPSAWGISSWILFPSGLFVLYLTISVFGKKEGLENTAPSCKQMDTPKSEH